MMPVPLAQQGIPNPQAIAGRGPHVPNPAEIALRQSRKPTDRNLPDGIDEALIGEGAQHYGRMREVEQKLDAVMMRKRLDIQDSINRNVKRYRTMRIWISNTVENQPWQQQQEEQNSEQNGAMGSRQAGGRYRVKIEGRLLDGFEDPTASSDSEDEDGDEGRDPDAMEEDKMEENQKEKKESSQRRRNRLSHFFKSMTIDFDKPATPGVADLTTINWNKPSLPPNATSLPASADFDSLEFSRVAEVNLNVNLNLVRDENPERFRLSKELASMLDVEEEARSGIVVGLWEYISAMELQAIEEKRAVRCDDRLKAVCLIPFEYIPLQIFANSYQPRFSALTRSSSPTSLKAQLLIPFRSNPSNSPTPSASIPNSTTPVVPLQSTISALLLMIPCAQSCSQSPRRPNGRPCCAKSRV